MREKKAIQQSFELREFYRAYAHWLKVGAPQGKPFVREFGLCYALEKFWDLVRKDYTSIEIFRWNQDTYQEMLQQFRDAKLSTSFPFKDYAGGMNNSTQHKNRERVRWVKQHAQ